MPTKTITIRTVDITLLKKQQRELVRIIYQPNTFSPKQLEALIGILHLLDACVDQATRSLNHD